MAIDPRWNRLWAMIWDGPHADPSGAIQYWTDYIEDLGDARVAQPRRADARPGTRLEPRGRTASARKWTLCPTTTGRRSSHGAGAGRQRPEDRSGSPGGRRGQEVRRRPPSRRACGWSRSPRDVPEADRGPWGLGRRQGTGGGRRSAAGEVPRGRRDPRAPGPTSQDRKDPRAALPYVEQARRLKPLDDSLQTWSG